MPQRDIVVIGASAGGIEALLTLTRELPRDLPAALFVVVHVPPYTISRLPELLSRAGPLPAAHAVDGDLIEPGCIFIAPPNQHLLVRPGRVELWRGPRENHARPAVDPLFRTAARAYGRRVIGIVLSGALYDGSLGLMAIATRGGIAIVQDPDEAAVDSMPRHALRLVAADYVLPVAEIAGVLNDLTREPLAAEGEMLMVDDEERLEAAVAVDFVEQAGDQRVEEMTLYTCPDCGGTLWQAGAGSTLRFRCHVGHAYGPEMLYYQKAEELEAALWSSLRLLKEKATLRRQLATRGQALGNGDLLASIEEQAQRDEQHAMVIHELLQAMPNLSDVVAFGADPAEEQDLVPVPGTAQ
jgi:two-component system chemotaxis response regulator CheB